MSAIDRYPFLKAALEDIQLAFQLARKDLESPRHVVILLHDALEFLLYEILLTHGQDIYKNGQSTIGLDAAIRATTQNGVDLPLIGTIRAIQKHRGDAKHHAQVPQQDALSRMVSEFRVIASLLIYEVFGLALGIEVQELGLLPYHVALYESYRKHRTHKWPLAQRFAIAAVLHKHRAMLGTADDFLGGTRSVQELVDILADEIGTAAYPPAPMNVLDAFTTMPAALKSLIAAGDTKQAAELAGQHYAKIDAVLPGVFDVKAARKLTDKLFQPQAFRVGRGLSWSKYSGGDTVEKHAAAEELAALLKKSPEAVKTFGKLNYMEDDDRYWRWWEFVIFDGTRWETFHLDDHFDLMLETGGVDDNNAERRQRVAKAILHEFRTLIGTV